MIQDWRGICVELRAYGDVVVLARKTNVFVRELSDDKYESLTSSITSLPWDRRRDGRASKHEVMASRAMASKIREKVTGKDEFSE